MRTSLRSILLLLALLFAYLLPTAPAYAAEKKVMGDVTVGEGETAEEVSTVWGDVTVKGNVENDVKSAFGNVSVEGPVGGNVDAGAGDVYIYAPVGGNVDVGHGDVYLKDGAQVNGDVHYHNGRLHGRPDVIAGSQVAGGTSDLEDSSVGGIFSNAIGWMVMTLGLIAVAVLLTVAAPRPLRASARSLETVPGRSLILGLGSVPAAVVISVLLALTGVGILLLVLLWPVYLALVLFGVFVAAYFLGSKVVLVTGRYRAGDALAAAIGAFLVSAAYLIPIFGGLVFVVLALLGAGAAVLALFTRRPFSTPRATHASYEDYPRDRRDT
jgi:hypothetical protein